MITVDLDRLLQARRMSLTELSDRVGVTMANLSVLKTGKARAIRFTTLNALCRELECQPGEILGHAPSNGFTERKEPPFATITPGECA